MAGAVGAGTLKVGSTSARSLAAGAGAGKISVWVGAGVVNIARFPPRRAAPAAAMETMIKIPVLTVRPVGIHPGRRYAVRGGSAGESAASHSEENGRGASDRPERTAMRPGISLAPVVFGWPGKPAEWRSIHYLRGT